MFLIKSDVDCLYECGFLKADINFLLKLNEEYLDHITNQEEAIIEKILDK